MEETLNQARLAKVILIQMGQETSAVNLIKLQENFDAADQEKSG